MHTPRSFAILGTCALLVAACGGGNEAEPTSTSNAPPTTIEVTTTTAPSTTSTTAAPVVTTTEPPSTTVPDWWTPSHGVLRGDGLGPHRFGAAEDEVVAWLEERLGPPDTRAELRPPLAPDMGWFLPVEIEGPVVHWYAWPSRTAVAFAERSPHRDDGVAHLIWWSQGVEWGYGIWAGETPPEWTTPEGVAVGSAAAFRQAYPDAVPNEAVCDGFIYFTVPDGTHHGAGLRAHVPAENAVDDVIWLDAGGTPRCTEATVEPQRPGPHDTSISLHGSGVGEVSFGTSIADARPALELVLGPPSEIFTRFWLPGDESGNWTRSNCYFAQTEATLLRWSSPRLTLAFHDGLRSEPPSDGVVRFVLWHHELGDGSAVLSAASGARPGITVEELARLEPDTRLVQPYWFAGITGGMYLGFDDRGEVLVRTDWDAVTDVQRALASLGYEVELDGMIGPLTSQALAQFRIDRGLARPDGAICIDVCCEIAVDLLTALGVPTPAPSATVLALAAGAPGSCDGGC